MKINLSFRKSASWIEKKSFVILWLGIIGYFLTFLFGIFWKYYHFGYNALDLGIFNQVFYNTSFGDLFAMTIHPHSYLGDHFEIIILLLTPLYLLFRHPLTLLILQTAVLAISAWPLYLIAKKVVNQKLALLIALIFLLCPFVQNINLFEFHILPFAIPFIFFAFYFYQLNRFSLFLLFSLFGLLVREDVALVIVMFAFLSLLDKKRKQWFFTPLLLGIGWLSAVILLVPLFNHYKSYKFLFYYSWLGDSLGSIVSNLFTKPLDVVWHLLSFQNITFILALFLSFLLLPVLKPKYLLLALLAFFQLLLGNFGSELILKTHYSALILPSVFLSTVAALGYIFQKQSGKNAKWKSKLRILIRKDSAILIIVLITVTLYGTFTFGPIIPLVKNVIFDSDPAYSRLKQNYVTLVPEGESAVTSYDFLPQLSLREQVYSLHYAFVGKKQYSQEEYQLPEVNYMLIDSHDFLIYQLQYPENSFYQNAYSDGDNRIRLIIQKQNLKLVKISDGILLYQKNVCGCRSIDPYEILSEQPQIKNGQNVSAAPEINFLGWEYLETTESTNPLFQLPYTYLPVSLYWQAHQPVIENYQLALEVKDKSGTTLYKKYYPLAYGIYPSSEWKSDEVIKTNYWFLLPEKIAKQDNNVFVKMLKLKEGHPYLGLDGLLSATMKNAEYDSVGEEILLSPSNSYLTN